MNLGQKRLLSLMINALRLLYPKILRRYKKNDTKAVDQGIARMEQLSEINSFIKTATNTIKDTKSEERLYPVQEFKRIAAKNLKD